MAEQNTTTQPVALQVPSTVRSLIEALIFGAREPLSVRQIQALYEVEGPEGSEPRKIDYDSIARFIEELNGEYTAADRPYRIVQVAGGYQFATQPAYAEWLGKLYKEQTRRKLSQSSIESLAIIAYKQPITKPEIEAIRGVNCDYVLSTLLEKDMATIVGRAPTVGRPLLYGTTKEFLKHFGLNDLNDLPRPREIQEILGDGQFETERRMLEAEQGLLEEKKEEDFKSRLPHIPRRKAGMDDDVKIVPKKRTREIKVRHNEEAPENQTGKSKADAQLTLLPDAAAPVPPEDVVEETTVDSVESLTIPTIENEASESVSEPEAPPEMTDPAILAESLKYIDLTQKPPASREVTEEAVPVTTDHGEEKPVVSEAPGEELIAESDARNQVEPSATSAFVAVPDESNAEISPPRDVLLPDALPSPKPEHFEASPPDESPAEVSIDSREIDMSEVFQPIDQPPDEPAVEPQAPGLRQVPEIEQDHHQDLKSKSRWTSWKEKIQGFIKKLFG
ncbi:MAG: SMC-Scp complex subunit ScpB [Ignavibacteria bacterium GWA2_54_16]|nr:MAG: SMC-Scp complex subunit ScpB [Ignavibacteria bacterium GWA2_54_16]